jgi:hypothetical protein
VDVFFHHLPAPSVADFEATAAVVDELRDRVLPCPELSPRLARAVFRVAVRGLRRRQAPGGRRISR